MAPRHWFQCVLTKGIGIFCYCPCFSLLSLSAGLVGGPSSILHPPELLLWSPLSRTPFISLAPWRGGGLPALGCQRDRNMCLLRPQSVGSVYSGLMQGVGAAEKVFEFIDRQPTMAHDGNLAPDHLEGRVDFENVTFTYRTRPHTQVLQVRRVLEALPDRPLLHPVSCAPPRSQAMAV